MTHLLFQCLLVLLLLVGIPRPAAAGSLEVTYEDECLPNEATTSRALQESGAVAEFQGHVNEAFHLPHDIKVVFVCAGDEELSGPFYNPDAIEIVVPYAFRTYILAALDAEAYSEDPDDHPIIADDILLHTLYHELGHAFIDILELPITGKEEDVVDEFSTLLLLERFEDGGDIALSAGDFFDLDSSQYDEITESDLFGEHSLDAQRFFNILCLVYGDNPKQRHDLFEGLEIDAAQKDLCIENYDRRVAAWDRLLAEHRKGR